LLWDAAQAGVLEVLTVLRVLEVLEVLEVLRVPGILEIRREVMAALDASRILNS
jgi:hypothetical protein